MNKYENFGIFIGRVWLWKNDREFRFDSYFSIYIYYNDVKNLKLIISAVIMWYRLIIIIIIVIMVDSTMADDDHRSVERTRMMLLVNYLHNNG